MLVGYGFVGCYAYWFAFALISFFGVGCRDVGCFLLVGYLLIVLITLCSVVFIGMYDLYLMFGVN